MPDWDPERLISASEVERWTYCPLSWFLEREDSAEDTVPLRAGTENHNRIGRRASGLKDLETGSLESRRITLAYLSFASVLIIMSLLLLLLTNVGFLTGPVWQTVVIISSIVLLVISLSMYLIRTMGPYRETGKRFLSMLKGMERSSKVGNYFPFISYLFGILLLVNGIVLLRPLGIPDETIITFFTMSLLFLYGVLLAALILFFMRARREGIRGDVRLGVPMAVVLVVGLSVLFIIASERVDPEGILGWIFLVLSFLWFIGALLYDLVKRFSRGKRRSKGFGREDLPMATIALMASVFTVMAFFARGENLSDYNTLTVVMATLWLAGAVFFFIKGSSDQRTASRERSGLDLPSRSRVISVDDIEAGKRGKPLVSKKHFLVGSPDIMIEENGKKIPVEIKTGKAPPKPHFSHIMQIAAYLVLVDVNYKQDTPYGYIEYATAKESRSRHKIEWDMMTKALVLSKVSEIREAERVGEAHRNHDREGKCRHCSRREGCPERLV